MLLLWVFAVLSDNLWLAGVGALLLLILLGLPLEPPGVLAPKRTLEFVGVLLFALVLALAAFALRETGARFEVSRDALPLLAVLAASAGIVGLVWTSLWRAVAIRPAPWKPAAFALCLTMFLAPVTMVAFSQAPEGTLDPAARFLLAVSAAAIACAAALPFVDSAFDAKGRSRSPTS